MKTASKPTQPQVIEITPALLDALGPEIDAALNSIGEAHGVTLTVGNITWNKTKATARFTITPVGANPFAVGFEEYAPCYGLVPADLGQEIKIDSKSYAILGLNPRATKRPVILRRSDGEIYNFPVETVRAALGRSPMTDAEELEASINYAVMQTLRR